MKQQKLLFVLGKQKTATSSLVALLNAHPDIFILYEVSPFRSMPTRRATEFIKTYPESRSLFVENPDISQSYHVFSAWLQSRGFPYTYMGDKIPDLSREMMLRVADNAVIYAIRDIRSWLIKEYIREAYVIEQNIVPASVGYCKHFCTSFLLPKVLHIRFDNFIHHNARVISDVCTFLDIKPAAAMEQWWDAFDTYDDMKQALSWWTGHASSQMKPFSDDTTYTLKSHPFWDALLPIFEKYYHAIGTAYNQEEITADLAKLDEIRATYRVPLHEAYALHTSYSLSRGRNVSRPKKPLLRKVAYKMKYMMLHHSISSGENQ